jgi:hypothetical protein
MAVGRPLQSSGKLWGAIRKNGGPPKTGGKEAYRAMAKAASLV